MRDATEVAEAVRSGARSAEEVVAAAIERCRTDPFNAITTVLDDRAVERAAALDAEVRTGRDPGPLAGVPVAVKNLVDVAGITTIAGSRIWAERPPATTDAEVVRALERAGAVLVATTNMDEFAYGFTTENTHYGATRNPVELDRIAGGSSGGSGAAVRGGLVPLAIGSDTNGSIRVPAALCGVYGFRPTMGRVSLEGVSLFVRGLDTVGPLARSARDLCTVLEILGGPTVTPIASPRLAVLGGYFAAGGDKVAHDAVDRAASLLGVTATETLPTAAVARSAALVMTAAEGAEEHLDELRTRSDEFDPMTRDRFLAGAQVPAMHYLAAVRAQRHHIHEADQLFERVDVALAPAVPCVATPIGQRRGWIGGHELLIAPNLGMFTQPISFAHLPTVVVPIDIGTSLPVAVQVIAGRGRDEYALAVAEGLGRLEARDQ